MSDADVDSPASVSISFEGSLVDQKPALWRFWRGALAGEDMLLGLPYSLRVMFKKESTNRTQHTLF